MQLPQETASSPGFSASRSQSRSLQGSPSSPSWALTPGAREPDDRGRTRDRPGVWDCIKQRAGDPTAPPAPPFPKSPAVSPVNTQTENCYKHETLTVNNMLVAFSGNSPQAM